MSSRLTRIFVCPYERRELKGKLFEPNGHWSPPGNRWIWEMVKMKCNSMGIDLRTIDEFDGDPEGAAFIATSKIFFRFRQWDSYAKMMRTAGVRKRVLLQGEPPVISPNMYVNLERFGKIFTDVYYPMRLDMSILANGLLRHLLLNRNIPLIKYFSLAGSTVEGGIIEGLFHESKREFLVMIQGNKFPIFPLHQLYGVRIAAVNYFAKCDGFSLYGKNWDSVTLYPRPLRKEALKKCYRGSIPPGKKLEVLAQYKFCLCIENSAEPGYVTERIFDAFAVGTVPVYLGAPDVGQIIPKKCFIDMREYSSFADLESYLKSLTTDDIERYRRDIMSFVKSNQFEPFTMDAQTRRILGTVGVRP